jgi:hypothetical protein
VTDARVCAWCLGPIPDALRSDAVCCSKRCRQARHRFGRDVGMSPVAGGHPRRIAYADPPYPGKSKRYYGDHPDYAGEVDHAALVASLAADYDAWALSTSAAALQPVLEVCPPGVRVAAWFRGARANKAARLPINGWEPVIYGGQLIRRVSPAQHDAIGAVASASRATRRADPHDASSQPGGRVDSLVFRPGARTTDPARVTGAKPATFCRWLFELLDAQPGDEFVDVFPGSNGVARAWEVYASRATSLDASSRTCATEAVAAAQHDASRSTTVPADAT